MIDSPRLNPTRPDSNEYPVSALHLAVIHNRETFEEAFGIQAPPFDPTKPAKAWAITGCTADETFQVVTPGTATLAPMQMTPAEAAAVNIPGSYRWPAYEPVLTSPATISQGDGTTIFVKGEILVLNTEAKALAAEITKDTGVAVRLVPVSDAPYSTIDWTGEPRRHWRLEINDVKHEAADLMRKRHEAGVNRPGLWVVVESAIEFVVTVVATEPQPNHVEVPIPIAPLAEDEALYLHPFSGVMVRKVKSTVTAGADSATLSKILEGIEAIRGALGA